jgi:anti-sigma B factor antagonist
MSHSITGNSNAQVLNVDGALDALSSPELRPTLDALTRDAGCNIMVNLTGLNHLDSSGVGLLVSLYKRARANHGKVSFTGVSNQPLCIFKLLGVDRAFDMAA